MGRADILRSDTATFEDLADLIEALLPIRASRTDVTTRTKNSGVYSQIDGTEIAINVRDGDILLVGYGVQYSHSIGGGLNVVIRVDASNIAGPVADVTPDASSAGNRIARGQTFVVEGVTPGVHSLDLIGATATPTAYITATHIWAIALAIDS